MKPALEAVTVGWKQDLLAVSLTCTEVSPRSDPSGKHVSTKLCFMLAADVNSQGAKVVVHFYHTSNTIQVQGASIMPVGISSSAWLVKYFLEPLAQDFISSHTESITDFNNHILGATTLCCDSCKGIIRPTAAHAKDRQITCDSCGKSFHKKCSNRRKVTHNWTKRPWFCDSCILTGTIDNNHLETEDNNDVADSPEIVLDSSVSSAGALTTYRSANIVSLVPTLPPENTTSTSSVPIMSVAAPTIGSEVSVHTIAPSSNESVPNSQPEIIRRADEAPIFPRNNTRHRTSNINVKDAEKEFLETALKTCRSTITQQEVEIKRFKENLDIRNKRISQLEKQVSDAAYHIADRSPQQQTTVTARKDRLEELIHLILSKLDNKSTPDITINNNQNGVSSKPPQVNQFSQTDKTDCSSCSSEYQLDSNLQVHVSTSHESEVTAHHCEFCKQMFDSQAALIVHMGNHNSQMDHELSQPCTECGNKFSSIQNLVEHMESVHTRDQVFKCTSCDYEYNTDTHLADHMEACHMEVDNPNL